MDKIDKLDQSFVDFVHSHTATVWEVKDIVGEDSAKKWISFILKQLVQPSYPYDARKKLSGELGAMNEPDSDKLMKIMIRFKVSVGNIEPLMRKNNGNSGSKAEILPRRIIQELTKLQGVVEGNHHHVIIAINSTPYVNVTASKP